MPHRFPSMCEAAKRWKVEKERVRHQPQVSYNYFVELECGHTKQVGKRQYWQEEYKCNVCYGRNLK